MDPKLELNPIAVQRGLLMRPQLVFMIIIAAALPMLGCGGKKVCKGEAPGSFASFLENDWRTYCAEYRQHVESPADFTMVKLTTFFGEHPARVTELNKSLYGYDKFETCFESPKEELELRELQTCLQDNDQSDIEITNAWTAISEPWIDDLKLRVQEVSPRMSDAEREAKRQLTKVNEAFDRQARVEGRDWESLQVELKSLDKAISATEGLDKQYKALLEEARPHKALLTMMESNVGPEINAITADTASLRGRHTDLMKTARYLEFAASAAGVKCPASTSGASAELKVAKKVVEARDKEVGGSGPRILTKIRPDASGDIDFERFEGFVCGIRGSENQFEGSPQLCGQYRFVVERQKPAGASKKEWADWVLKSFEESGSNGGIDCALKKK